ncbi:MAG: MFS transporter [Sphingobacteriia bacterium]|nr:MFS transporter [Sphingobacteriia bacterium]
MSKRFRFLPVSLGVLVEHYDTSLYGFMSPLLIELFFPNVDPINGIMLILSGYGISLLGKPIGAVVLGMIGDKYGRKRALVTSILGMGIVTIFMGLLPTYAQVGGLAPVLLILSRLLQAFFVAGEYNGGAIFIVEHNKKDNGLMSGIYCSFTAIGILLASIATTLVIEYKEEANLWRVPYFIGAITALIGLYFRLSATETPEFIKSHGKTFNEHFCNLSNESAKQLVTIIVLATFISVLYMVPTIMVNSFITIVTNITVPEIMKINSLVLVLYAIMLPFMGMLTDKLGTDRLLYYSLLAGVFVTVPTFTLLTSGDIWSIFAFKLIMITICAAFITAFHPWSVKQFPVNRRYTNISFGYSIGSQIGAYAPTLSLSLYKQTGIIYTHGFLIMVSALLGLYCITKFNNAYMEKIA